MIEAYTLFNRQHSFLLSDFNLTRNKSSDIYTNNEPFITHNNRVNIDDSSQGNITPPN